DTITALAGALVGFYQQRPVFHVEAGLRTSDPALPFPEEMNRRLVTRMARLHFAPTETARAHLLREHVPAADIQVTGNTGIDALKIYAEQESPAASEILGRARQSSRKLLVTLHRRENVAHVEQVTRAIREVVTRAPGVDVLWILHLNATRALVM